MVAEMHFESVLLHLSAFQIQSIQKRIPASVVLRDDIVYHYHTVHGWYDVDVFLLIIYITSISSYIHLPLLLIMQIPS